MITSIDPERPESARVNPTTGSPCPVTDSTIVVDLVGEIHSVATKSLIEKEKYVIVRYGKFITHKNLGASSDIPKLKFLML